MVGFDAIQQIRSRWKDENRLFIGEFDFKRYFDNISQQFLLELLDELNVYRTPQEDALIRAFLSTSTPAADEASYKKPTRRKAGLPQGTSISLFLANLALTPVDRELDSIGVNFVRYADDTLIWSREYQSIVNGMNILHQWTQESGVSINYAKSEGIRVLKTHDLEKAEIKSTRSVSYLSHDLKLER
ncbi:hypothetical protein HMPREF3171_03350 [Corynebacterium sp. HMSC08F01]|nr:hypothetical protein HMPREF3171_03350 [Corynebacterium sp. HMSC08F01]